MALCVVDGLDIDPDTPTWAVYADDAFEGKPLEAMALHATCFEEGEWIEASWWENDANDQPILRSEQRLHYKQVDGPGNYLWSIDPETNELIVVVAPVSRARANG